MKKLLLTLLCVSVVFALGCVPSGYTPNVPQGDVTDDIPVVRLSQDIIDTAVEESATRTDWGINLGKVRINYVIGTKVQAAIVLHNGDDCERLLKIEYQPIYETKYDMEEIDQLLRERGLSDTEIEIMALDAKFDIIGDEDKFAYEPAPIQASGWVSVDTKSIRLSEMQTEVVPIYLLVPNEWDDLPDRWEFRIRAIGIPISQYQYTVEVTTVENDTVLEQHLPMPLLEDNLESVLDIISTGDEIPYATNYDSVSGILTIEGLQESTVRQITIIYEYGEVVAVGYNQRWLITMLE